MYETLEFDNARSFLDALRRSNPRWLQSGASLTPWVFRGQGNASWALVPSAWRATIPQTHYFQAILATIDQEHAQNVIDCNLNVLTDSHVNIERVRHQIAQRRYEFLQVHAFVSLADELGMAIPGGFLDNTISREFVPTDTLFHSPHPAYALAQHHGMATRLLDWTQNPLYAAFFAAESPNDPEGTIAVWALNSSFMNVNNLPVLQSHAWREYRVPRSQIGFLHSQAGLFTFHDAADLFYVFNGEWPSMEREMEEGALAKLVLPSAEASELRRLLFAEGVSRAHLMPTLDNVRQTLQSHWEEAVSAESSSL